MILFSWNTSFNWLSVHYIHFSVYCDFITQPLLSVSFHDFSSHPWPYNTQVLQGTVCWSLPFLFILTPLIILPHQEALITLHIWQFPNLSSLYGTHISHCLLSIFISIHNSKLCKSNWLSHSIYFSSHGFPSSQLIKFQLFSFVRPKILEIIIIASFDSHVKCNGSSHLVHTIRYGQNCVP